MERQLKDLLERLLVRADASFGGVGLLISSRAACLPVFPLRDQTPLLSSTDLESQLLEIAAASSRFHDGFHILSPDWRLTHVAQYFSPPIPHAPVIDRTKDFGGRYVAALFGSALPEIEATGIASRGFGVAVFFRGREVYFRKA